MMRDNNSESILISLKKIIKQVFLFQETGTRQLVESRICIMSNTTVCLLGLNLHITTVSL